ncbi:MAG: DUF362 domain-containing protein [Sedimentisphaerales bacterium]|nr:DUF362 domain-containing protein [Sedimentisphaerales bacterium]
MTHKHTRAQAALIHCNEYRDDLLYEALMRQFTLLGGLDTFVKSGETVLLKPNFIAPRPRQQATQTDPAVIIALARLLKDFGAKPFVGDSPAWGDVFACAQAIDLDEPLRALGVPLRQLDNPRKIYIPEAHCNVGISAVALDADKIINVPKFKSHQQLVATFAVKNMFGTVSGKAKAYWHFVRGKDEEKFCKLLIGIYAYLNPILTIIDGITAMEGPGPINGRPRPLGFLIAGQDPIACEIACARLIALPPEDLPIVRTARKISFGCGDPEHIEFLGDDFDICRDFERAELIPIRFSLPRVCKSIAKQLLRRLYQPDT